MGMTPHTFGARLTQLLLDRHWSVRTLAQALNVERSLIYKWRRGDRTPQLASNYVSRIAAILSLTPDEVAALEAAQHWSLSTPRPPRVPKQTAPRDVQQLLDVSSEPITRALDSFDTTEMSMEGNNTLADQGIAR